jgi:hypothetical protein
VRVLGTLLCRDVHLPRNAPPRRTKTTDAHHSTSMPNRSANLLGECGRKLIVTTINMEILAGYLFVEIDQKQKYRTYGSIRTQSQEFNASGRGPASPDIGKA